MVRSVFKTHDEFGAIEVLDDGPKRILSFGSGHEQSLQLRDAPHIPQHEYARAMMLVMLLCQPKKICLLGLGGGSLATAMLHILDECELHTVELRKAVIKVAHRYFQLPRTSRLHTHHCDATEFIDHNTLRFDLVMVDLYLEEGLDMVQLLPSFIAGCSDTLNDGGWLVLNYWLEHDLELELTQQLQRDFAVVYACNCGGGNRIIYAGKTPPADDFLAPDKLKSLASTLGYSLSHYAKRLQVLAR